VQSDYGTAKCCHACQLAKAESNCTHRPALCRLVMRAWKAGSETAGVANSVASDMVDSQQVKPAGSDAIVINDGRLLDSEFVVAAFSFHRYRAFRQGGGAPGFSCGNGWFQGPAPERSFRQLPHRHSGNSCTEPGITATITDGTTRPERPNMPLITFESSTRCPTCETWLHRAARPDATDVLAAFLPYTGNQTGTLYKNVLSSE
jgi:hypothetical protein